uniref:Uncharacterized protein n=1 Tax=Aegilops tauschii subsp. strangulata TaxID=200361 RepID=A0A453HBJ7_AEGTS
MCIDAISSLYKSLKYVSCVYPNRPNSIRRLRISEPTDREKPPLIPSRPRPGKSFSFPPLFANGFLHSGLRPLPPVAPQSKPQAPLPPLPRSPSRGGRLRGS